eukprot:CAMPEP_0181213342 /NCGR_PEP_ID=MMETSP1096-20121128/24849_1 /TAXON_ID=156174 ORGANISM="Chrysochromulina ericina, Strain CCMP281" /NCGR_SAMPLE_ID=MMETSP1096 /ASSEMBLY_ACC=CAM_ASM_000453 /LENGTH=155 /DNA_ID=CAMNT_0023304965 /DNA_START=309 /DNA_END=773 /DNA_ORIENTATION=+
MTPSLASLYSAVPPETDCSPKLAPVATTTFACASSRFDAIPIACAAGCRLARGTRGGATIPLSASQAVASAANVSRVFSLCVATGTAVVLASLGAVSAARGYASGSLGGAAAVLASSGCTSAASHSTTASSFSSFSLLIAATNALTRSSCAHCID